MNPKSITESPHEHTDFMSPVFAIWGASAIAPDAPSSANPGDVSTENIVGGIETSPSRSTRSKTKTRITRDSEWISPRSHPFATSIPVWIQFGAQEVLQTEIKEFGEAMQKIQGNKVNLIVEKLANHDVLLVGNLTGFETEADRMGAEAGRFVKEIVR